MPFRFRLAKVLRHRQRVVEARSREVAVAGREVQRVRVALENLASIIAREASGEDTVPGAALRPHDLQARMLWRAQMERRRRRLAEDLDASRRELAHRRELLTEAWRSREVLDRLQSLQAEQWAAAQRRRELATLDEIGQQRSERARRSKVSG